MCEQQKSITEAKGTQKVALFFLLLAALFVDAFALYMVYGLIAGNPEYYYGLLIACIVVSLLGGILTIAFPVLLLKKFREPSLRLYLPGPKPEFGEVFKGHIVISMAASQTPPIAATLKLTRYQSDSIEFSDHGSVVWEKESIIESFTPMGARQCKGEFEILLLDQTLFDLRYTGSFHWHLFVRSSDPRRTFGEVFNVPVTF